MFTLKLHRKALKLTLDQVEKDTKILRSTLSRIENGKQQPKREDARTLYKYYKKKVPLEAIYDPELF